MRSAPGKRVWKSADGAASMARWAGANLAPGRGWAAKIAGSASGCVPLATVTPMISSALPYTAGALSKARASLPT